MLSTFLQKSFARILLLCLFVSTISITTLPAQSMPLGGLIKGGTGFWVGLTHPVESIHCLSNEISPVEKQHVSPQREGYDDQHEFTVYWSRSNHTATDRWRDRPFGEEKISGGLLTLGNSASQRNLKIAYNMGIYGIPYSVFFHSYTRSDSEFVFTKLDGPSMLLYGISWVTAIPKKFVRQAAYIASKKAVGSTGANAWYFIDLGIGILVLAIDFVACVLVTVIGGIIATILHPINSLCSIPGFVAYLFPVAWESIVGPIWELVHLLGGLIG